MGDIRRAANEYGMSLDDFFFQSAPEDFEGVDWNDNEPSEDSDERLERLREEIRIIDKWGLDIPERLRDEYGAALDEWCREFEASERCRMYEGEGMEIGSVDDFATDKDIQL